MLGNECVRAGWQFTVIHNVISGSLPVHAFTFFLHARLHQGITSCSAVVPSAEPFIEWDRPLSVVHFEILMVKVVRKSMNIDCAVLTGHDLVKADVSNNSATVKGFSEGSK